MAAIMTVVVVVVAITTTISVAIPAETEDCCDSHICTFLISRNLAIEEAQSSNSAPRLSVVAATPAL
jgi:hypothetical protein